MAGEEGEAPGGMYRAGEEYDPNAEGCFDERPDEAGVLGDERSASDGEMRMVWSGVALRAFDVPVDAVVPAAAA